MMEEGEKVNLTTFGKKKQDQAKRKGNFVSPLSRPDSFSRSEPSLGCSNVTPSPYQNHLSKTRFSVTLQLA